MAKKLLVKTPVTKDGVNLKYDDKKQPVYKTSVVELNAKKLYESFNSKLPEHLRHELKEVEVNEALKGASNEELKNKLAQLEARKENKSLQDRIDELEAELAERSKISEPAGSPNVPTGTVAEIVEKIKAVSTKEDVEAIVKDDDRKGVKEAAGKRIKELEGSTK